jgi:sugar/nucleoside kinase (ribokinase family)
MQFPLELVTDKQFAAVGFGLNAVDHLIVVPEYPAFDTKMRFIEHQQSAGGQTATAMVALRRLGLKTAYAGRFGADAEGRFGLRTLIDDDVNVDFAEVVEGARNQIAFITIDARSGERTIVWDRDDRRAYKPDEAPVEFSTIGRVLHLDAHDPPACVRMGAAARAAGTIVSADIDNVYPGLPELLPYIDILIGSKEFPERVTGVADERAALIELKTRFGCAVVGMTIGAAGAGVYCDGSVIEAPGFEAPGGCRDTTGAGDAFHGGFLFGLLTGEDVETSLRLGNAVAAMKCSKLGARTALPTHATLKEFRAQRRIKDATL